MTAAARVDPRVLSFADEAVFGSWMAAQPAEARGLWSKRAKKCVGVASVSRNAAIDAALCYGWIDRQPAPFDLDWSPIRFTPRRAPRK